MFFIYLVVFENTIPYNVDIVLKFKTCLFRILIFPFFTIILYICRL